MLSRQVCCKGQQDRRQGQHADARNRTKQHPTDNAAEKYQDPQRITEKGYRAGDEIAKWVHFGLRPQYYWIKVTSQ